MLKNHVKKIPIRSKAPVWAGPESDAPNGGITFSLLSRFLVCRERFRVHAILGLRPAERFNHRIEYGSMWHACEEALAAKDDWQHKLTTYCQSLCQRYPLDQEQISKWFNVCKVQFPEYVRYWAKHQDVENRTPLLQEQTFNVPYRLPSGRVVRLRGKWDSVDLIGKGKGAAVYLQENKTKGDVDEIQLQRQLRFDLQTMMYLIALRHHYDMNGWASHGPLAGVRYNVIRRPLSGGKGSIRQHAPTKTNPTGESAAEFYERLRRDYIAAEPGYWFMRWKVDVTPEDVKTFKRQCLDPILESLCAWYDWVSEDAKLFENVEGVANIYHWRHPFGVFNPLDEGGATDLDEYLTSGSEVGLRQTNNLFPELQDADDQQAE